MYLLYNALGHNEDIALDLPFREATGAVTRDVAPLHHDPVTLVNTPTWTPLASGLGVLEFNGVNEYLRCLAADTADLDFTNEDYSLSGWFYDDSGTGDDDEEIINRFVVSNNGWELYLYTPTGSLNLRHHHAGGATLRSSAYSLGWGPDVWHFFGVTRVGAVGQFYRNGIPVPTIHGAGGLIDPEASVGNLYMANQGADNFLGGRLWRPRVWVRALAPDEWWTLYNRERGWFA